MLEFAYLVNPKVNPFNNSDEWMKFPKLLLIELLQILGLTKIMTTDVVARRDW